MRRPWPGTVPGVPRGSAGLTPRQLPSGRGPCSAPRSSSRGPRRGVSRSFSVGGQQGPGAAPGWRFLSLPLCSVEARNLPAPRRSGGEAFGWDLKPRLEWKGPQAGSLRACGVLRFGRFSLGRSRSSPTPKRQGDGWRAPALLL